MGESTDSSPGRVPPIIIAGPTGTAKSALAQALARELDGGIISADSMLARSGFKIGNGRSTLSKEVVYHLVSNVLPDEIYFSNRLLLEARSAIEGICWRCKLDIICCGWIASRPADTRRCSGKVFTHRSCYHG